MALRHAAFALPLTLALAVAGPALAAPQVTELAVKGPVQVEIDSVSVSITVVKGGKDKVRVTADLTGGIGGGPRPDIDLRGSTLSIDGLDPTVKGSLKVEVPAGSSLQADAVQGDITASGVARVDLEAVAGNVKVDGADRIEIETVSGGIDVTGGTRMRIETVAGKVTLAPSGSAPDVRVAAVSGPIVVRGACGKGCQVRLETLSGAATVELDRKSSFTARLETFSGKLIDKLGLGAGGGGGLGRELRGRYGNGEGTLQAETFSGSLTVAPLGGK